MREVKYHMAYMFAYSMRDKTHAHRTMQDNVPPHIKQQRLQELIDTFRTTIHAKNSKLEVGKYRLVLIEGTAKRTIDDNYVTWSGRTDQNKRILFPILQADMRSNTDDSLAAIIADENWVTSQVRAVDWHVSPSPGSVNPQFVTPSKGTTILVPGDYAVVQVTEAKGHTLRGKVLWKTTLAKFAELESNVFSKWNQSQSDFFAKSLLVDR